MDVPYRLAGPHIVHEDFDGDLVVLDLKTGRYFSFNAPAAAAWTAVVGGSSPSAVVAACGDGPAAEAVIRQMIDCELVVPSDGEAAGVPETEAAVLAGLPAPEIEMFDDLADLIAADPIHDVEVDVGWPHVAPGARDGT